MSNLAVDTPPPPSPTQAPPSYDSLSDHGTHIHSIRPYHFTNPTSDTELEPELEPELVRQLSYHNDSLYASSGEGLVDDSEVEGRRPEDPPPPYSPGLRYIRAVSGFDNVFVTDAPPSYSSIFGQIREARVRSQNNWAFLRRLSEIILNTVGCTILLIVFMSVPLAILVLGSVYVFDCPLEPKIPIFLIVGGITGVLKNIFLIVENVLKRHSRTLAHRFKKHKWIVYTWRAFNLIFNLFVLAWIICGSYWIFSLYTTVHAEDFSRCNELLYKFGFSIVISSYILLVLMCCCTCVCAGVCLRRKKDRTEEEEEEGERRGEEDEGEDGEGEGSEVIGRESEGDNESLTRETIDEEMELDDGGDDDSYLNGRRYHMNGDIDAPNEDMALELSRSMENFRETRLVGSTGDPSHPLAPPIVFNGGVLVQQFESSPYPSRHQVSTPRISSNTANLSSSNQNVRFSDQIELDDDGFEMTNAGHAHFTASPQSSRRHGDRPMSLSHLESNSVDSIPAMRACALIRNRVHHSSHSSGLYVTQCSEGFSITAV